MKILRVNMSNLDVSFEDLPEELTIVGGRGLHHLFVFRMVLHFGEQRFFEIFPLGNRIGFEAFVPGDDHQAIVIQFAQDILEPGRNIESSLFIKGMIGTAAKPLVACPAFPVLRHIITFQHFAPLYTTWGTL